MEVESGSLSVYSLLNYSLEISFISLGDSLEGVSFIGGLEVLSSSFGCYCFYSLGVSLVSFTSFGAMNN